MKIFILMIMSLSLWANIGNIMSLKGNADIKRENTLIQASSGMELLKGDEVVTYAKSRVQVMLKDDTVVTIGQNSSFGFEDFVFDGTKESKLSMKATRGFFRSVTGKLGKVAPERFKVKTASATIGIRGTDFSGDIAGESQRFVCYSGAIFVEFDGVVSNIDAGMVMQIINNKVEIKKVDVSKVKKVSEVTKKDIQKVKEVAQKVTPKEIEAVVSAIESVVDIEEIEEIIVPQEVISEITQVIETQEEVYDEPHNVTPSDSLEVTPNAEDREAQY